MPLYEYRCAKCDTVFEVLQKFSDPPLTTHDGCGGSVERLISAPGFQFKGSGWYVTDYKNSGGNATKTGEKSDSKTETKSESKGDSKPASTETKTESKTESKPTETSKKSD